MKALFVNSTQPQCGVHQYGIRVYEAMKTSTLIEVVYLGCESLAQYEAALETHKPSLVIYNYHPLTMPWFNGAPKANICQYQIHHEGTPHENLKPHGYLYADCSVEESQNIITIPRPLFDGAPVCEKPTVPTISSFGFGFGNKNYGLITKMVNEQFEEALLRLHIPRAYFGDRHGEATSSILPGIHNEMVNPGIRLEISHGFLSTEELLRFLGESSLNIFLYDRMEGRGLSSTIDYALSVDTPLAINTSYMFRHIYSRHMDAEVTPLKEIIVNGTDHFREFRKKWNTPAIVKKLESLI